MWSRAGCFTPTRACRICISTRSINKLEKPVAESKYIVRIKAKDLQWSNFLMASTVCACFPPQLLKTLDGASYLQRLQLQAASRNGSLHRRRQRHQERHVGFDSEAEGLLGREVPRQRRAVQLRRVPLHRRPRSRTSRLRCSREGPRLLQRQNLEAVGGGSQLRRFPARSTRQAQGLQQLPFEHAVPRLQYTAASHGTTSASARRLRCC